MLIFLCKKYSVQFRLFKAGKGLEVKKPKQLAEALEADADHGYVLCRARDFLKLLAEKEKK